MNRKNIREVCADAKEHAVTFHDTAFKMENLLNELRPLQKNKASSTARCDLHEPFAETR